MVDQRQQRILKQLEVILTVDTACKPLVVIRRPTHHRQHFTCAGIHRNHHAGLGDHLSRSRVHNVDPANECFFGRLLQFKVQSQAHVAAWDRVILLDHAQRQPGHIHFAQAGSAPSGQFIFQEELDPGVANPVKRGVIALLLQFLGLLRRDGPQVANNLGGRLSRRVFAHGGNLDAHAGQHELFLKNAHRHVAGDVLRHDHRVVGLDTGPFLNHALQTAFKEAPRRIGRGTGRRHIDQRRKPVVKCQGFFFVCRNRSGDDRHVKGGHIECQLLPVPIKDHAA